MLKKLLSTIFLSAFVAAFSIQMIAATALFILPAPAQAAEFAMDLEVPIPGLPKHIVFSDSTEPIAKYIKAIYTYAVGAVGIVAAVVLMIGGLMWITAGGNASSVSEAKSMITASLTGLVLVLTSYLLLSQVNPALVNLQSSVIKPPEVTQTQTTNSLCKWVTGTNQETNFCPQDLIQTTNIKLCGPLQGAQQSSKCCCPPGANWSYQSGIEAQEKDASPQIDSLIACLKNAIPATVPITINSISDSQITPGGQTFAYCRASGCSHTVDSCHYGGINGPDKSYAVDLGGNANAINAAAYKCPDVKFINPEGTHVHISVLECQSDHTNVEVKDY
ncbi:MAG: pilin [Patescibacteria group bacterium]|nr:pilin [Patescibacteria group bacterium]